MGLVVLPDHEEQLFGQFQEILSGCFKKYTDATKYYSRAFETTNLGFGP